MADTNIKTKQYLAHEVLGNLRMDLLQFAVVNDGVASAVDTRLHRVIACDVAGQDGQKRNVPVTINQDVNGANPGSVLFAVWPASTTDITMIVEAWGY